MRVSLIQRLLGWLSIAALLAAGCGGGDGLDRQAISGQVTLDGAPLESGSIRFEPVDGRGVASGAVIIDGAYQVAAAQGLTPGTYHVSISSAGNAVPAQPSMDNEAPLPEERIPVRYNTETELQITIAPQGPTDFPFDLTTPGK